MNSQSFRETFSCSGQIALVTGGGTGIGQAIALGLLNQGASHVFITGRRQEKLNQTATIKNDNQIPGELHCVVADVTNPVDRERLVTKLLKIGRLDTLVNNAGAFAYEPLASTSDAVIETLFSVNVTAPVALMRDLLPLLTQARGSVINISSSLAVKPIANTSAYNGAKAAIIQITKSLACELGPSGVRINTILPAVVETPMYRDRFDNEAEYQATIDNMAKEHPLQRVGKPDDIAYAATFLASPAAAWITGVAMPVDGGMLCT